MKNTGPVWKARMTDKVGVDKITHYFCIKPFSVCICVCVYNTTWVCYVPQASHLKDTPGENSYLTSMSKKSSVSIKLFPFLLFPVA